MEAKRTGQRWSYAEFARVPTQRGVRHELIAGELVMTPSPSVPHQGVVTRLVSSLHGFVHSNHLGTVLAGPIDVLLDDGEYLAPDIVFVRNGRDDIMTDRGIEGPPDLVVEVTSPSTASRDRGIKLDRYRRYGVGEYWVVDPKARSVEVWDLADGAQEATTLGGADVLGWVPEEGQVELNIPLAELFETE